MAYAALPAKIATDTLDLADYNKIKGNFEASGIDIVTAKGDLPVATGANALTPVTVGANDSTLVADSTAGSGVAWQIQPACRAYNAAVRNPATSTWTTLSLDLERYDTDGSHSTVSLTSRLTVPTNGDGIYHIGGTAVFDTSTLAAGTSGRYGVRILLNNATVLAQHYDEAAMQSDDFCLTISADYGLVATDFVELQVYTTQDIDILGSTAAGNYSSEFWFHWVRRA